MPDSTGIPTQPVTRRRRRLADQLVWMTCIRLVIITSVLLPAYLIRLTTGVSELPFDTLLRVAALGYLSSLLYLAILAVTHRWLIWQAYAQFMGDLVLITALVYFSGGIASPFSMLYLIVISVAAVLLRRRAGVTVAEVAWLLYALLIFSLYQGWIAPPGDSDPVTLARLIYALVVHLFGFYGVALLTAYLARDVARVEQELEERTVDLAELEVFNRDVIESMTSGLITTDVAGKVVSVNRVGRQILGLEDRDFIGEPLTDIGFISSTLWTDLLATSDFDRVRDEVEYERDGDNRWIGFSIAEIHDAYNERRGYIIIFQDLTAWKKLQEELSLKDRMAAVGELAAGLAHEIGNPLAAISGSVQMLSHTVPADGSQKQLLDITLQESRRLDRIIKNFLQFARPADRREARFDVAKLLDENLQLLRNSEEVGDHHQIVSRLDPPSASIVGDPDQISQIFWNLVRNAIRAMPEGGRLTVAGEIGDSHYSMKFEDTGRGMTEEERGNLFHPFKSSFIRGTGLGMAIVYRIVEEHGGRIDVRSSEGVGTAIEVNLPLERSVVSQHEKVTA